MGHFYSVYKPHLPHLSLKPASKNKYDKLLLTYDAFSTSRYAGEKKRNQFNKINIYSEFICHVVYKKLLSHACVPFQE